MNEGFKKLYMGGFGARSEVKGNFLLKQADKLRAERRDALFEALVSIVEQKRQNDPSFKLTYTALGLLTKANPKLFLGISSPNALLNYWAGDADWLRLKIDQAIAERKKS